MSNEEAKCIVAKIREVLETHNQLHTETKEALEHLLASQQAVVETCRLQTERINELEEIVIRLVKSVAS